VYVTNVKEGEVCCLHTNLKSKLSDFYAYQQRKLNMTLQKNLPLKRKLPPNIAHWFKMH